MHEDADQDQPTDPGDRRAAWRDEARSLHEEARALRGELSAISGSLLRLEACIKSHLEENAKVLPVLEDLVALRRGSQIVMPILVKIGAACATVACSLWAAAYWMRDHVNIKW